MKRNLFKTYTLLLLIVTFISCNEDDKKDEKKEASKTTSVVSDFLKDYADKQVAPLIQKVETEITTLDNRIETFTTNPTTDNLNRLKQQWFITAKEYSQLRIFTFGDPKKRSHDKFVFRYPCATNKIDQFINGNFNFDLERVRLNGASTFGLTGIEYLIYENDEKTTVQLFKDNTKRKEYLNIIGKLLLRHIGEHKAIWNNYRETFVNNSGTGLNSSISLSFNEIINQLTLVRIPKLGEPAAIVKLDRVNPKILETFRSGTSLEMIEQNLKAMESAYFGNENTLGFHDIIDEIDENNISEAIEASFTKVYSELKKVQSPLKLALTEDATDVKAFYDATGTLHRYLALDVASLLSVTVVPADIDGD